MWRVSTVLALNGLSTPYAYSAEARDRGTNVHSYNHALATGREGVEPPDDDDPHGGMKQALRQWYQDFDPTVLLAEHRIVCREWRLTGRIDLAVIYRDSGIIVDVKTGAAAPSHGIQVCGYCDLASRDQMMTDALLSHTFGPWDRAILYLHENGKYDWRGPMRLLQDGPQDAYLWRSAASLVAWKYDHNLLAITDSETPDDDVVLT